MTAGLSEKGSAYVALVALAVVAAVVLRRPEPVALAAPFAVALAAGLARAPAPSLEVAVEPEATRTREGARVGVDVRLRLGAPLCAVRCALAGAERSLGDLPAGVPVTVRLELAFPRRGIHALGEVGITGRDPLGLLAFQAARPAGLEVRVDPALEPLRALPEPARMRVTSGDHLARVRGAGVEPADVRPLLPGDRLRDLDARTTARRAAPYVRTRQAERNADLVVLVDALSEPLDRTVRAAAGLAWRGLAQRDRVALAVFGGVLDWVEAGAGRRQWERVVGALARVELRFTWVRRDVRALPPGLVPAGALVLAVSPLRDERAIALLADARSRGFDLAVVEVEPSVAPPGRDRREQLVSRLWRLERDRVRARFGELGVPVATWAEGAPLEAAVGELVAWRRRARGRGRRAA